ncbi:MAG TPA: hypothetical protein VFO30_07760, partial [Chthoniobacterales bacterium]|nr:hypothetical protein [Chthoniobacterales bacterium]
FVLCHNPADPPFYTIDGTVVFSDVPATYWTLDSNTATQNAWGYQIIDGANHNVLLDNAASDNSAYDVEFVGESDRYGFHTPTSFKNFFIAGSHPNLIVKDCGRGDVIKGNVQLVDHNSDPCF